MAEIMNNIKFGELKKCNDFPKADGYYLVIQYSKIIGEVYGIQWIHYTQKNGWNTHNSYNCTRIMFDDMENAYWCTVMVEKPMEVEGGDEK